MLGTDGAASIPGTSEPLSVCPAHLCSPSSWSCPPFPFSACSRNNSTPKSSRGPCHPQMPHPAKTLVLPSQVPPSQSSLTLGLCRALPSRPGYVKIKEHLSLPGWPPAGRRLWGLALLWLALELPLSLKALDHFIRSQGHSPQGQIHLVSLSSYFPGTRGGLGVGFLTGVLEPFWGRTSIICPVTVDFAPSSPAAEVAGESGHRAEPGRLTCAVAPSRGCFLLPLSSFPIGSSVLKWWLAGKPGSVCSELLRLDAGQPKRAAVPDEGAPRERPIFGGRVSAATPLPSTGKVCLPPHAGRRSVLQ